MDNDQPLPPIPLQPHHFYEWTLAIFPLTPALSRQGRGYLLNNSGQGSMCSCPFKDERGQRRNPVRSRHPIKEELPKGNPEFATGLFETGEGVPTASPKVAAGTAADLFSFLDIIAAIPTSHLAWRLIISARLAH